MWGAVVWWPAPGQQGGAGPPDNAHQARESSLGQARPGAIRPTTPPHVWRTRHQRNMDLSTGGEVILRQERLC